jgi:hypothetical protein
MRFLLRYGLFYSALLTFPGVLPLTAWVPGTGGTCHAPEHGLGAAARDLDHPLHNPDSTSRKDLLSFRFARYTA